MLEAIEQRRLGRGSVAESEYLRNMRAARVASDGMVKWVEVCYCATPLDEERPYWERYFELRRVQDAHILAEPGGQRRQQVARAGHVAGDGVTDAHGDRGW